MFSLIVTLISIALVAALVVATVFYGGNIFTGQRVKAQGAKMSNESAQIAAAAEAYLSEKSVQATTFQELIDAKYLNDGITSTGWTIASQQIQISGVADDACIAFNKQQGIDLATIPACSDATYAGRKVCCSE